jgi:hypothetical protein
VGLLPEPRRAIGENPALALYESDRGGHCGFTEAPSRRRRDGRWAAYHIVRSAALLGGARGALQRPANRPYWRYDHAMPGSKTVREGRTSRELMNDALHADDEDVRSNIIGELQRRGTREELELMAALFEGGEQEQVLACEVLGQLGFTRRELGAYPFGVETAALVQRGLRSASTLVQEAAVAAVAHLKWEPLFDDVISLATSSSARVRYAAAFALGGRSDDASVRTLIALSDDADDDVRNWATFGLGSQCERRDPFICDALARRLHDPHDETRHEAWAGLASKQDMRAFEAVLESLESDNLAVLAVEAAGAYGHAAFLPALLRWRDECDDRVEGDLCTMLDDAITACRAGVTA